MTETLLNSANLEGKRAFRWKVYLDDIPSFIFARAESSKIIRKNGIIILYNQQKKQLKLGY